MLGKIEAKGEGEGRDEMVRQHHQLNGHEPEQIQETVEDIRTWCSAVRGVAESDKTQGLNSNEQQQNVGTNIIASLMPYQGLID